jgi:hypothetical protein
MLLNSLKLPRSSAAKPTRAAPVQDLQLCGVRGLPLLDEAQPLAQDFTRILVPAGPNKALNEFFLMLRKHDISPGHRDKLQ